VFDHVCYSVSINSKYLVLDCPETQRPHHVTCHVLEVPVIHIVKLLINFNEDTLVSGAIEHGMFLALYFK
jgi:hypothetical protein